jgi:hypothetical protein
MEAIATTISTIAFVGPPLYMLWRRLSRKNGRDRIADPARTGTRPSTVPRTVAKPQAAKVPRSPGSGVFISYRRDDKRDFARSLYERLARHLGDQQVFMDVDSIDLGVDFTEVVNQRLAQCSVMLVVIGKGWIDCVDSTGRRRLDNPDDLVRLEVETALARPGVRVIPILVDGAKAPESTELPGSLASLARRNALIMTHENFTADFGRLFTAVQKVIGP